MGILEDINRMQQEGKSDQEMSSSLQESGYGGKEISEALSQMKIKQAVNEGSSDMMRQNPELEQSMMNQPPAQPQDQQQSNAQQQQYATQDYGQYQQQYAPQDMQQQPQQQNYDSYSQYGSSSDTISEIAEQVVAERLSGIKKQFESILDMRTTLNTKVETLNERLTKIEKIIDRLQLSILQKVGDYMTNVEDIKKEMAETQKSFKYLLDNKKTDYKQIE
ncbi:MAG: hypothetical protein WCK29_01755 [archaeon]